VHEPRDEPREQLPLPEHDLDLVANALRRLEPAVVLLRPPDLADEELRAVPGAAADDEDEQPEDDGAYPRTFRSSALIAGTISCRSPITA
jgi:hypothetical protein